MSTNDAHSAGKTPASAVPGDTAREAKATAAKTGPKPRPEKARQPTSIVPSSTIAGRALVAVVAIMTFLAAITIGSAVAVRGTASQWRSDVTREVTIQVRAGDKATTDAQVQAAADIARKTPGIADATSSPARRPLASWSRGWAPASTSTTCRYPAWWCCASTARAPPTSPG